PHLIARQSACRTTEMADQRTVPNNQTKTTPSTRGLESFSTVTFPVAKMTTAVIRPTKRGYSVRVKATRPDFLCVADLGAFGADMSSTISSASGLRNRWVRAPVGGERAGQWAERPRA